MGALVGKASVICATTVSTPAVKSMLPFAAHWYTTVVPMPPAPGGPDGPGDPAGPGWFQSSAVSLLALQAPPAPASITRNEPSFFDTQPWIIPDASGIEA